MTPTRSVQVYRRRSFHYVRTVLGSARRSLRAFLRHSQPKRQFPRADERSTDLRLEATYREAERLQARAILQRVRDDPSEFSVLNAGEIAELLELDTPKKSRTRK
jgi:hypothetical protein